jgi:uncharacterized membrane protein YgdD (TMEM256/DUF423 family)
MTTTDTRFRGPLLAAAVFGLTGVALGAFGAHGLAAKLAASGMTNAWESAARYQMLHALALFGAAVWLRSAGDQAGGFMAWASRCWSVGILLFSGSLYWLALGGPKWLGPVTPLGGVAFLVGWACVAAAAFAKEK